MLEKQIATKVQQPVRFPSQVEACGKVILVGEHAVVYGARAVAIPLKELTVQMNVCLEGQGIDMTISGRRVSNEVAGVVEDAFTVLGEKLQPCKIRGSSSLPTGAGLGSSASLCVAVLRGIAMALGKELSNSDVAVMANKMEERFHGTPSGLDTAAVAHESALCFQKKGAMTPASWNGKTPLRFVLIDSGVRAATFAMVKLSEPYFKDAVYGTQRVKAFDRCAERVVEGLKHGDRTKIIEAMEETSCRLNDSGVVTAHLMDMMKRASDCGVDAIKPTGAGGGGYLLGLLPEKTWQEVQTYLENCFGAGCVLQTWLSPH
ncbi:MAG: mevalonate kinase [Oligoflexales bacterium]